MATKLKNKLISSTAYIISILLLSYAFVTMLNAGVHYENLIKKSYFDSQDFIGRIQGLGYDVISYYVDYKDYSQKSLDDKVSAVEIESRRKWYEDNLKERVTQITEEYRYEIASAEESQNKDRLKSLTEERDKKLEDAKKELTKTTEELKKEIAEPKDREYEMHKSSLGSLKAIQYFVTNKKSGETYTNIPSISNIENYMSASDIKSYMDANIMYSIKFPLELSQYRSSYNDINRMFMENSLEGYFVLPQEGYTYSPVYENYHVFQHTRQRVITEGKAGIVCLFISLIFLIFSSATKPDKTTRNRTLRALYLRIPIELRILLLFLGTIPYLNIFFEETNRLYDRPIYLYIFYISGTFIYLLFALDNLKGIYTFITNKEYAKQQLHHSIIYKCKSFITSFWSLLTETFIYKNIILWLALIIFLSILPCFLLVIAVAGNDDALYILVIIYVIGYVIFVPKHILKQLGYLNKILKGTDEIISGNLNFFIEENAKGPLRILAHNINNIKSGLKKSLEQEMKSERLKSELITNVSHDLKTPLTSIINYVDLLKKEDLSREEINGYVAVLDRKTQRLKTLIEDLFEASKMASGSVELNLERLDVGALLNQALGEFDEKIKASGLVFKVNAPKQKIYANLDGKKTWRVFENLISNALKYSMPNTRVYIDLTEVENKIQLVVKNISSYEMDFDIDEIFERFKRGDKSRHTEGSGLGLAIARSIVELQGGKLNIEIDGDLFKAVVQL